MEIIKTALDFLLNINFYLNFIVSNYGVLTYLFLFFIVFMETGFVITPFLPGDSLLFAAGAIAASSKLKIYFVWLVFFLAAVMGDTLNYWIGRKIGLKIVKKYPKLIQKHYLAKAQNFYKEKGHKAIVIARFVPIIRTFAPFVAGIAQMQYGKFFTYSVLGGFIWVTVFTMTGYLFGNIPFVESNFHYIVVGIVIISLLPVIHERLTRK